MAFVDDDPGHPDLEGSRSVIAVECGEGGDEARLGHVERFVAVPDMAAHEAVHPALMPADQLAIGRLPACKRQSRKLPVRAVGEVERHFFSAVSAFTTASSNLSV